MRFDLIEPYLSMFQSGLVVTLTFTLLSLVVAAVLGVVVAVLKVIDCRPVNLVCQFYTSLCRGIPLMVQLFLVYFATPQLTGYRITPLLAGVITFGLNGAATISEVLRGGIQAVDRGQYEASVAMGIGYVRMMKDIIFPQALRSTLPSLINEGIMMLKNSSLISTIGVVDILRSAQTIQALTYVAFEPLIIAAAMYYVLVMVLTALAGRVERRLRSHAC
ncbi:amino acid ABC transporter permease [Thermophilibacter sp.]